MRRRSRAALLSVGAAAVTMGVALAAPQKLVSVKWPGGAVTAAKIDFRVRDGKVVLAFSGGVRATAQSAAQRIELEHAERATADVATGMRFSTLRAEGDVRFWVERKRGDQTERAGGRCNRATIHNPGGRKLTGSERFLVADLVGDVLLTLPAPKGADGAGEPMTLEGEHGQVWLTAEGYEGSISSAD